MSKAISLISGGLDSTLATRVMLEQGIELVAANFVSPFCRCNHGSGCRHEAKFIAEEFKIPLKVVNMTADFLEMLKSPKHGYGSHMNPCIDCRILMLKKAKDLMIETGASFLVTGEVVGQRPMSQKKNTMDLIEKEAGVAGLVLRPLSAKLLKPTIAEEKGWVDRSKLLEISGRGRKPQMQMAKDFNIKDYPCPAGGCLLTDPNFSPRIKDLIEHKELTIDEVDLLKYGRYFRISPKLKLVVGRNERDNKFLESCRVLEDAFLMPADREAAGASAIARGQFLSRQEMLLVASIVARYFDKKHSSVSVKVFHDGKEEVVDVVPMDEEEVKKYLI